jgi:hypothetical protein
MGAVCDLGCASLNTVEVTVVLSVHVVTITSLGGG